MSIVYCNESNFKKTVLDAKKTVLVDFNASWCPPCRALHPTLEELADESDDYIIVSVDVDESPNLAQKYEVSSIPCLIVLKSGVEIERRVGLLPKKRLIKMLGK